MKVLSKFQSKHFINICRFHSYFSNHLLRMEATIYFVDSFDQNIYSPPHYSWEIPEYNDILELYVLGLSFLIQVYEKGFYETYNCINRTSSHPQLELELTFLIHHYIRKCNMKETESDLRDNYGFGLNVYDSSFLRGIVPKVLSRFVFV